MEGAMSLKFNDVEIKKSEGAIFSKLEARAIYRRTKEEASFTCVFAERVTTTLWSAFVFLGHFHSLSLL